MKYLKISIIIILILLATVWLFFIYQKNQYHFIQVKKDKIKNIVAASGTIKAEKTTNLSFNKVGRISYLPVKINDQIKKGQVLASLDRSDLMAVKNKELKDYLINRWNLEQLRDNYNIKDNYKKTTLTDEQKRLLEQYRFIVDKNVINVEIADRAIKEASLIAPFSGIVTQVNGQKNEWTSAFSSQPLVQVVDFSTLYFEAQVDQEYSNLVAIEQKTIINLDAYPKIKLIGKVYQKEKVIKKTTEGDEVVVIRIKIKKTPSNIILGLKGDAQIINQEKTALLVPKEAVFRKNNQTLIKLKKGFFFYNKKIVLGIFDGQNYEVIKGLKENDQIWFQ